MMAARNHKINAKIHSIIWDEDFPSLKIITGHW
jgi:hypothetical protein